MAIPFSVVIMAGGRSSRMGTDKAFVQLLGKPLVEHILERVADLGQADTFLVTNRPDDYAHLGLRIVSDVIPDKGSLGGIYTALTYSQTPYTLVVACDMPLVNPDLLRYMLGLMDGKADIIVPRVDNYPEGMHALYHQNCLEPIKRQLDADKLKIVGFYKEMQVRYLDEPEYTPIDPQKLSFFNVNTPEELAKAQRLAAGTADELTPILERYQGRQRDALLPVLWDVQTAFGQIDANAVHQISHTLHVPEAEIYGVIEFYTLFHHEPTGERIIRVCVDPACGLADADGLLHRVCSRVGLSDVGTTPDGKFTVEHSPCLGLCDLAPAVLVSQRGVGEMAFHQVGDASVLLGIDTLTPNPSLSPFAKGEGSKDSLSLMAQTIERGLGGEDYSSALLAGKGLGEGVNVLLTDPEATLADYGDYASLRRALFEMNPDGLIAEVEQSGLIGRGGAAFPTGMKWKFTRAASGSPKYVVANADESEPGTFKDRVLMETRPHLLLEGIALCAYAIGAEHAYLFLRGEYPDAYHRLAEAIQEAEHKSYLGKNIMGSEFSLTIEIRRGGGAYICGEETALFEAIEGKRGFPRIKPPYPTTHGLFQCPTTVNNVETLCAVVGIVQHGADWFREIGTEKSTGPKLISVSGHIQRPGVYEIRPGLTLRQVLEEQCGGIIGELQTVLMGGAAGTFLTPDELDVRLTFEDLRAAGSTFGSGAIMVFNHTTDLRDVLVRLARFFQHESCGKCFPCQLGTQRQLEILVRTPINGDTERLYDIGMTMTEASLCGLGQTAASAVLSALHKYPHIFA